MGMKCSGNGSRMGTEPVGMETGNGSRMGRGQWHSSSRDRNTKLLLKHPKHPEIKISILKNSCPAQFVVPPQNIPGGICCSSAWVDQGGPGWIRVGLAVILPRVGRGQEGQGDYTQLLLVSSPDVGEIPGISSFWDLRERPPGNVS